MYVIPKVWHLREQFDKTVWNELNNLVYFQDNRIHLIQNNPNQLEVKFFFLNVDPLTTVITSAYSEVLETQNRAGILLGMPTRVEYVGSGADKDNVLILLTLTLPRGEQDLKDSMTLG